MEAIKKTKKYSLLKGELQARGLYNVIENDGEGISLWFDNDTAKELRKLKANDFNTKCAELIKDADI